MRKLSPGLTKYAASSLDFSSDRELFFTIFDGVKWENIAKLLPPFWSRLINNGVRIDYLTDLVQELKPLKYCAMKRCKLQW